MSDDLLYTINEACKKSKHSRTRIYEELAAGRLTAIKSGTRTLIPHDALARWIASLPQYEAKEAAVA